MTLVLMYYLDECHFVSSTFAKISFSVTVLGTTGYDRTSSNVAMPSSQLEESFITTVVNVFVACESRAEK